MKLYWMGYMGEDYTTEILWTYLSILDKNNPEKQIKKKYKLANLNFIIELELTFIICFYIRNTLHITFSHYNFSLVKYTKNKYY
jgi:hypothetical protein